VSAAEREGKCVRMKPNPLPQILREEWLLAIAAVASVVFLFRGSVLIASLKSPLGLGAILVFLFAVVLAAAIRVVHHAERLAMRLGDPYGTLVLTLAVTTIEVVSLSAVILHGGSDPTLVRDSLLSVVMIILNGMVGLSLLIGGWRHREQHYNLQGANIYLSVIVPLVVLSLVLPTFTRTTPGPTLSFPQSVFLIVMAVSLYVAFLGIQAGRHRAYFVDDDEEVGVEQSSHSTGWHAALLVGYLLPVVILAEQLARPIDYFIETLHAPMALGGLAIALLVATPEALSAIRAASENSLQRAMNIFLGSVLATIGLTIPAMLAIGDLTHRAMILGVQGADLVMLLLTLAVSILTFASGRTNVLQGVVHLLLFAAYLLLMFQD
jgi:Ca2+:H+ antiporter